MLELMVAHTFKFILFIIWEEKWVLVKSYLLTIETITRSGWFAFQVCTHTLQQCTAHAHAFTTFIIMRFQPFQLTNILWLIYFSNQNYMNFNLVQIVAGRLVVFDKPRLSSRRPSSITSSSLTSSLSSSSPSSYRTHDARWALNECVYGLKIVIKYLFS